MSTRVHIAGMGAVDWAGAIGGALPATPLPEGGIARLRWRQLFESENATFRRLDPLSRCVSVAVEAAGAAGAIPPERRGETALVMASRYGCLHSDLRFEESRAPGRQVAPAVFPYTLPSTCLGELAVRHGFKGPMLCLSSEDEPGGEGLIEARALIELGEASAAIVCLGDYVGEEEARKLRVEAVCEVVALVLLEGERPADSIHDWAALLEGWPRPWDSGAETPREVEPRAHPEKSGGSFGVVRRGHGERSTHVGQYRRGIIARLRQVLEAPGSPP